ncbi:HNH endonuclease [Pirellulales bacterium]|nr:HNH endonuclease [Pirellulales bacterium]
MKEIADAKRDQRGPEKKYFNRYNKPDVKQALAQMYGNLCCYCEAPIAVVAKGHIEHRKPKAAHRFPELAFEWVNLHLSCPNCNSAKGDQWDTQNEILDAVHDAPIEAHLSYRLSDSGVLRDATSPRGKTTVQFADLNRDELRNARVRILMPALQLIKELKKLGNAPAATAIRDELKAKTTGPFASLIEFGIHTYLVN